MIRRPRSPPLFPSPPLSRSAGALRGRGLGPPEPAEVEPQVPAGGELQEPPARQQGSRISHGRASIIDRKSTRLNSSHSQISYAVFCLKKKKTQHRDCASTHD